MRNEEKKFNLNSNEETTWETDSFRLRGGSGISKTLLRLIIIRKADWKNVSISTIWDQPRPDPIKLYSEFQGMIQWLEKQHHGQLIVNGQFWTRVATLCWKDVFWIGCYALKSLNFFTFASWTKAFLRLVKENITFKYFCLIFYCWKHHYRITSPNKN